MTSTPNACANIIPPLGTPCNAFGIPTRLCWPTVHETIASMTDQLTRAAEAYRAAANKDAEARDALAVARKRRAETARAVERTRGPLAEAIIAATRAGVRQRDILATIGGVYTRERIRQICRAAGIDANEDL